MGNKRDKWVEDEEPELADRLLKGAKIFGGIILALWIFFAFVVIIPAGNVGVLFDKLQGGVIMHEFNGGAEGFGLKIPITQSVTSMNVRTQTVEYRGDNAITPKDKNGINFRWDVVVRYKLDRGQAAEVFKTKGADYASKIISTGLRAKSREIFGEYAQEELPEHRMALADKIRVALQNRVNEEAKSVPELQDNFVLIEAVDLRNLEFNPKIEERIIQKQQRLQQAQEQEYNLQIAEKQRDIEVVNADAKRQKQILEAEGEAAAILKVAQAKAAGIQKVNDAYQRMPNQYVSVKFAEAIKPTDKIYLGFESLGGSSLGVMNYNQLMGVQNVGAATISE